MGVSSQYSGQSSTLNISSPNGNINTIMGAKHTKKTPTTTLPHIKVFNMTVRDTARAIINIFQDNLKGSNNKLVIINKP
tara:strand:+ start:1729 stop:1965 length:237 start_codon:yes stop_codon:yes gene_type:complete